MVERIENGLFQYTGEILDGKDATFNFDRGFFGVGVFRPNNPANWGQLARSSLAFKANHQFMIGAGPKFNHKSKSDTARSFRHIPLYKYQDWKDFKTHIPSNIEVVAIDNKRNNRIPKPLSQFKHPTSCCYILGTEAGGSNGGLPDEIIKEANHYVMIESIICLNLSVAGSIILYDRLQKGLNKYV